MKAQGDAILARLTAGRTTSWLRPSGPTPVVAGLPLPEIQEVRRRFARFKRPLAYLFPDSGWDGRIQSPFERYPGEVGGAPALWVKSDARLPMTGKSRYAPVVSAATWRTRRPSVIGHQPSAISHRSLIRRRACVWRSR